MNNLIILPLMIPLFTAIAGLFAWRSLRLQRWISFAGSAGLLAATVAILLRVAGGEVLVLQASDWPAPFGITLVVDIFSGFMLVLGAIIGLAVNVYSFKTVGPGREAFGYYPLCQIQLMGVSGAFLTGDIFNLYVWFEVLLIASFVLMALGGEVPQLEGALKYVTLNLLSSAVFLVAVGILYAVTGSLNMAALAGAVPKIQPVGLANALAMLFLIAFGIKAAIFPLFFWLPSSYHTPPAAVSALFAGLLTKVGVYALIRVFTLIFTQDVGFTHGLIVVAAGLTMLTGVLGAVAQNEFRKILSFHIISQIGYMIMGLGLYTPLALAGSVFYIIHHIIVKANLFLVAGVVNQMRGSYHLKKLGGMYQYPLLAILFLIPAFSLAGVPPLSGFFAKLALVQSGLATGDYAIVGVALAVSLLTMFSMTKIWGEVFWKPSPVGEQEGEGPGLTADETVRIMLIPVSVLAAITVALGLGAEPIFALAVRASEQLLDPTAYIHAVLRQ